MKTVRIVFILAMAAGVIVTSGCASYRVSSNIRADSASATEPSAKVMIIEGALTDHQYSVIGPIEVSVKKLTLFHKDPTRAQANEALIEKARVLGADAVINVTYESGIGLSSWGYLDAKGTAVKFTGH